MDAKQPGVEIDLGGLRMVADSPRVQTEQAWRPGATRARLELDHGIRFGLACPGGQGKPRGEGRPRRAGDHVWDVAQGVPPVIGATVDSAPVPDNDFFDWFSELAMPWTAQP